MHIIFRPIYLEFNQGHGNARRASLAGCTNSFVALMDADDIALPNRFLRQMSVFMQEQQVDIVGGQITEFIGEPQNVIDKRTVPETDKDIKKYMKKRCPMNQVSVMFKKEFVDSVGGYLDWYCEEDYYLWIRMAQANGIFANVKDTLVNVRIGDEMSSRRGGWKYFSSEVQLQKYMLEEGIISLPRFLYNIIIRFVGEIVVSDKLRTYLFKFVRQKVYEEPQEIINIDDNVSLDYPPFSVAMCVYGGDSAEWFDASLDSIINQTLPPNEIVLVVDGPISSELQTVIDKYQLICAGEATHSLK